MRLTTRAVLGSTLLYALGCGSGQGEAVVASAAGAASVSASIAPLAAPPSASSNVVPDAVAKAPTRPFQLVADLPEGPLLCLFGDALGAIVSVPDDVVAESSLAIPFILRGNAIQRIGTQTVHLGRWERANDCMKEGDTLYVTLTKPQERGSAYHYEAVEGKGSRAPIDSATLQLGRYRHLDPPACGGKPRSGIEPMRRAYDFEEEKRGLTFLLGESCDGKTVAQVLSRDKKARFVELPDGARLGAAGDDVYVTTDKTIARWEGEGFSSKPLPLPTQDRKAYVDGLFKAPDGALLVTMRVQGKGAEHFILVDGAWAPLRVGDDQADFDLVQGPTTLWAFSKKGPAYRYPAPDEPKLEPVDVRALTVDKDRWLRTVVPPFSRTPPGPKCFTHVVVLYGFTKVTPPDYDFPLTRKALKGHPELSAARLAVVETFGKKYLVALVQSFEEATAISKVIEKSVQGSKPQIVCNDPTVVRELPFDWKTGELVTKAK